MTLAQFGNPYFDNGEAENPSIEPDSDHIANGSEVDADELMPTAVVHCNEARASY